MLTRLVRQLASVFVAQFDQEVASHGHNSGVKKHRELSAASHPGRGIA